METYAYTTGCENCRQEVELSIPKGVLVSNYCKDAECPHCGCALQGSGWEWVSIGGFAPSGGTDKV